MNFKDLTDEDKKDIAEREEKLGIITKRHKERGSKYPLSRSDAELVLKVESQSDRQNWKTFVIDDIVTIKDTSAVVERIAAKDIILKFEELLPPVAIGEVIEINNHEFRVRSSIGGRVVIRPLLGTTRQYV